MKPFYVRSEDISHEKQQELLDLAVDAGAEMCDCRSVSRHDIGHSKPFIKNWKFFGVGDTNRTYFHQYADNFGPDAVEMTYQQAWDCLQGLIDEQRGQLVSSHSDSSKPESSTVGTGMKFDGEKPMYNLLPATAIDLMAQVLTFGAQKYAPNSWQTVPDGLERYRAALLRHAFAIQRGEINDPETGLPHASHIMCCAAFIAELQTANE